MAKEAANINGISIDDTFAEAFGMTGTAIIITADSAKWAMQSAVTMTGFGTSVIGCGVSLGSSRFVHRAHCSA